MLLHAEAYQLITLDYSITVEVIPKDILDEVPNLVLILSQHLNQEATDLILLKSQVAVAIKGHDTLIKRLPQSKSKLVIREYKLLLPRWLLLELYVPFGFILASSLAIFLPSRLLSLCSINHKIKCSLAEKSLTVAQKEPQEGARQLPHQENHIQSSDYLLS